MMSKKVVNEMLRVQIYFNRNVLKKEINPGFGETDGI